ATLNLTMNYLQALLSTTVITDVFFFEYLHKFVARLPAGYVNTLRINKRPASYEAGTFVLVHQLELVD
ncbi:MAG: hypothetical protein RSA71_13925, partial [Eubacterium sp.]